jgi:membrane glycosyltransferase
MSELTRSGRTQLATVNGSTKNPADAARQNPLIGYRSTDQEVASAKRAVAEYLHDVGLSDPELIARESRGIVAQAQQKLTLAAKKISLTEAAIQLTVKQLDRWLMGLAAVPSEANDEQRLGGVLGSRLPDLLNRYPQAWRQGRPPNELVESVREGLTPVVPEPRHREMRPQTLALVPSSLKRWRGRIAKFLGGQPSADDQAPPPQRSRVAGSRRRKTRMLLALSTALTALLGTWMFCRVAARDGLGVLGIALAMLFAILLTWVAFSFWVATLGLIIHLRRARQDSDQPPTGRQASSLGQAGLEQSGGLSPPSESADLPPTALVMPIYNENPRHVFANIRAMAESLQTRGHERSFGFFVLSDSTDPALWLEEEREWAKLVAKLPSQCRVFYRHRSRNERRKAGNIADFCSRWGGHFRYMIVLDADSLMGGETLVEMVRSMERDPSIGILQAPTRPINRRSVFARLQQFAAHMYGPVFLEGFVHWSECDGNYYGHNAIIRVRPFMEHCELPILPGDGPLGGEILSHDFVEAALMRRAGWKVCIAHDLGESYEECPATILGFAQRDQRWCQGNLQHLRLLLAEGLHPASRLHFGMGAMSFLASPLWLTFLLLTVAGAIYGGNGPGNDFQTPGGFALFAVTMALLFLPKIWGVIALARNSRVGSQESEVASRAAPNALPTPDSGLLAPALASVGIETLVSMLIAPIMMLMHTHFVISTLLGKRVTWNAQQRDDCRVSLADAIAVHGWHTLAGLVIGCIAWLWAPGLLPWLSPVQAGLMLSIPLAMVLGSVQIGNYLTARGLLTIPEEVNPPAIVRKQQALIARRNLLRPAGNGPNFQIASDQPDMFAAVFYDPAFYALHVGILRATESDVPMSSPQLQQVNCWINSSAVMTAPAELRRAILSDGRTMERLHILARSQLPASPSILQT